MSVPTVTKSQVDAWYHNASPGQRSAFNKAYLMLRNYRRNPQNAWFGNSINPDHLWDLAQQYAEQCGLERDAWKYIAYKINRGYAAQVWPVKTLDGSPGVDPTVDVRSDPSVIYNVHIPPKILLDALNSLETFKYDAIKEAWSKSSWSGFKLILEDVQFQVVGNKEFLASLPYLGTSHLRYIRQYFVCRNYATVFDGIVASELHCDSVAKTLDYGGHHSYNIVVTHVDKVLNVLAIEPQLDEVIPMPDPSRHYTGKGLAILGG